MVDVIDLNQRKEEISKRQKRESILEDIKFSEMIDKVKLILDQCIDGLITIGEFKSIIKNIFDALPSSEGGYEAFQNGNMYLSVMQRQKLLDKYSADLNQFLIKVAIIKQLPNGRYRLYSRKKDKSGKRRNLGTFNSLEDAKKREKQVQFFKYHADDQNSRDKETKALSILSDVASYLEQAGYAKHAKDLYSVMDAIDSNLDDGDDAADFIPDAQRNIENEGTLSNTGPSSGLFSVQEAEKIANLANKLDSLGMFNEASQLDLIMIKFANLDDDAEEMLKNDPTALFEIGPEFFSPSLVKKYIKPFAMKNPFSFFRLKLEKKYPELAPLIAKQALINDDESFFNYTLHKQFPELAKEHMQKLAEFSPKKFFKFQYLFIEYPEFEALAARNLFRADKEEFKKLELDKKYPVSGLEDNLDDAAGFTPDTQSSVENEETLSNIGISSDLFNMQEAEKIANLANKFDKVGLYEEANRLDSILFCVATGSSLGIINDVKLIKRDYKDGKFSNIESAQELVDMLGDRLHMNPANRQEGGFIAGLVVAMDFMHPQDAFGDPQAYQSALLMFENPDMEMDNLDALVRSNGLQGTTSIDGGSAGMFQGLSDSYFYTGYGNLEGAYGPSR